MVPPVLIPDHDMSSSMAQAKHSIEGVQCVRKEEDVRVKITTSKQIAIDGGLVCASCTWRYSNLGTTLMVGNVYSVATVDKKSHQDSENDGVVEGGRMSVRGRTSNVF